MPGRLVGDRRLLTESGGTRLSGIAWIAVAVFATADVPIATEKINRVTVAVGGAAIMLALGATDAEHAFFSEQAGNVVALGIAAGRRSRRSTTFLHRRPQSPRPATWRETSIGVRRRQWRP